jgi:hypothetical protein
VWTGPGQRTPCSVRAGPAGTVARGSTRPVCARGTLHSSCTAVLRVIRVQKARTCPGRATEAASQGPIPEGSARRASRALGASTGPDARTALGSGPPVPCGMTWSASLATRVRTDTLCLLNVQEPGSPLCRGRVRDVRRAGTGGITLPGARVGSRRGTIHARSAGHGALLEPTLRPGAMEQHRCARQRGACHASRAHHQASTSRPLAVAGDFLLPRGPAQHARAL